jgi:predicted esterase
MGFLALLPKHFKAIAVTILALSVVPVTAAAQTPTDVYLGMEGYVLDAGDIKLPYRLARPTGYDAAKKYPLVVFLHGSGESGTDNKLQIQKNIGVPSGGSVFTLPANQAKYPTFFVAPQAPVGSRDGWRGIPGQAVLKLIAALEQQFTSIDTRRLYITGLSMGGFETWTLIEDNPKMFACAVPMSAGGDIDKAANLVAVPIWDFHGAVDMSVNVQESRDMINAIKAAGGNPKYTEYPNGGHAIWDQAYNEPQLLPWMFGQTVAATDVDGGVIDAGVVEAAAGSHDAGAGGNSGSVAEASNGVGGSGGAGGSGSVGDDESGLPRLRLGDDLGSNNGCSCRVSRPNAAPQGSYLFVIAVLLATRRPRFRSQPRQESGATSVGPRR